MATFFLSFFMAAGGTVNKKRRAQAEGTCWNQMIYLPSTTPTHGHLKNTQTHQSLRQKTRPLARIDRIGRDKKIFKKWRKRGDFPTKETTPRCLKQLSLDALTTWLISSFLEINIYWFCRFLLFLFCYILVQLDVNEVQTKG